MAAYYGNIVNKSAYTKLASQTLSSAAATVTFTNIPQNFTDLVLIVNNGMATASWNTMIRFNEDTGSNYDNLIFEGRNGASAYAIKYTNAAGYYLDYNGGADIALNRIYKIHIMQYSNPFIKKQILSRGNIADSGGLNNIVAGCYDTTSPITTIKLLTNGGNMLAGSTFTLYGVSATKTPKAFGGDQVYTDGQYWYHIFNNSGLFSPQTSLTVDYLVVAGGGGGSAGFPGSGGGAGGFRTSVTASTMSLVNGVYPVLVGSGGAGGLGGVAPSPGHLATNGRNGNDSNFNGITSTGGGCGVAPVTQGGQGGSGGGGGHFGGTAGLGNTPSTTPSQGNNGGAGTTSSPGQGGGGGGGAGAVGGSATGSTMGVGGAGATSSLSGATVTYAGGGGAGAFNTVSAGAGGAGGGGAGGGLTDGTVDASNGSMNTGGGGGGGGRSSSPNYGWGGQGGSGIVIVRYSI